MNAKGKPRKRPKQKKLLRQHELVIEELLRRLQPAFGASCLEEALVRAITAAEELKSLNKRLWEATNGSSTTSVDPLLDHDVRVHDPRTDTPGAEETAIVDSVSVANPSDQRHLEA